MIKATERLATGDGRLLTPTTYQDVRVTAVTSESATVAGCVDLGAVMAADVPRQAATFRLRSFTEKGRLVSDENFAEPPVPC